VLDFSTLLPGPFASLLLADMGAEVLRIESPTRMDLLRVLPPHDRGVSASHAYLNRNKRSLALDLKQPEALEIVRQLVAEYDIVLEQFRPGVMERLGLGYEALKAINPKLIYVSITGYGQTGPYKDRAGHDINYLALSGVASYTGRQDSGPVPLGVQLADVGGGSLHAVVGLLAAVIARQHSGLGQYLDVSMTDCAFSLNAMAGAGLLGVWGGAWARRPGAQWRQLLRLLPLAGRALAVGRQPGTGVYAAIVYYAGAPGAGGPGLVAQARTAKGPQAGAASGV
jgi:alpha-methylacyl-CoA racemase